MSARGDDRFRALPTALQRQSTIADLNGVPALLVTPEAAPSPPPLLIWIHGRTAYKELDPGRYLRMMRHGIAVCAVDLPGHGQRAQPALQGPDQVPAVVAQMLAELDEVVQQAMNRLHADSTRVALGGMSAGGMVALSRLCQPHQFAAATVEATSGSWQDLPMSRTLNDATWTLMESLEPATHLHGWTPTPLLAIHCRADQWIPFPSQWRFLDALERACPRPPVQRVAYDSTGAEGEHAGFGKHAADAKQRQVDFLMRTLCDDHVPDTGAIGP